MPFELELNTDHIEEVNKEIKNAERELTFMRMDFVRGELVWNSKNKKIIYNGQPLLSASMEDRYLMTPQLNYFINEAFEFYDNRGNR